MRKCYFSVKQTKPPTSADCHDVDEAFCNARKSRCFSERGFMSAKCKTTCKMRSSSTKCFDKDSYCPKCKFSGSCENEEYIL